MRKKFCAALCVFTAVSTLTACGTSFKAEESTVYVKKNGAVYSADIEDFNKDYYGGEELENFIKESVESYVASNGDGSVEVDSFKVKKSKDDDTMAQLYLNYASYMDYARFNEVTFYAGTVAQAQEEGFPFDQDFQKADDGKLVGAADAREMLGFEGKELKTVIIGEETAVKVDGVIQYVSDGNVELTGSDTANVRYDAENVEAQPGYIVYQ